MTYIDQINTEFDKAKRVLHLSAQYPIHIDTKQELCDLCSTVQSTLEKLCHSDRIYMIVDLSKFVISPALTDLYSEKIKMMMEHFIYRDGLVRYGYQVTRLTIKMSHKKELAGDPHLFGTYREALNYIESIITKQADPIEL